MESSMNRDDLLKLHEALTKEARALMERKNHDTLEVRTGSHPSSTSLGWRAWVLRQPRKDSWLG